MIRWIAAAIAALASTAPLHAQNDLRAAVLPNSRAAMVGETVTVFATMQNAGAGSWTNCRLSIADDEPYQFGFRLTDATNTPIGENNAAFPLPPNSSQSLILSFTPTAASPGRDVQINYLCDRTGGGGGVTPTPGVNTVFLSASETPRADIVPIVVTPSGDGVLRYEGEQRVRAFSAAAINIGAAADVRVSASAPFMPRNVELTVCETNPATGVCQSARSENVDFRFDANEVRTFAVFARIREGSSIPNLPAVARIYLLFSEVPGAAVSAPQSIFPPSPPILGAASTAAQSPALAGVDRRGVYRGMMNGVPTTAIFHSTNQITVGTPEALSDGVHTAPAGLLGNSASNILSAGYGDGESLPGGGAGFAGFTAVGGSYIALGFGDLDRTVSYQFQGIWDPISTEVFDADDTPVGSWSLVYNGASIGTAAIDELGSVSGSVTWPVADGASAVTCDLGGVVGGAQRLGLNNASLALNTNSCGPNYFFFGYYETRNGNLVIDGYVTKQGSRSGTLDFFPLQLVRQ